MFFFKHESSPDKPSRLCSSSPSFNQPILAKSDLELSRSPAASTEDSSLGFKLLFVCWTKQKQILVFALLDHKRNIGALNVFHPKASQEDKILPPQYSVSPLSHSLEIGYYHYQTLSLALSTFFRRSSSVARITVLPPSHNITRFTFLFNIKAKALKFSLEYHDFPDEVLDEIISRLSLKIMIRCSLVKSDQKICFHNGILSNISLTLLIGAIILDIKHGIVLMEVDSGRRKLYQLFNPTTEQRITLPSIPIIKYRIWHLYVESKTVKVLFRCESKKYPNWLAYLYTLGQPQWRAYNVSSYSNTYSTLTSIDAQTLHLSEKILKVRKVVMHDQGHLTLEDVNLSLELLDEMGYLKESTSFPDCTNSKPKFFFVAEITVIPPSNCVTSLDSLFCLTVEAKGLKFSLENRDFLDKALDEIISRLSLKIMIRCSLVSKQWKRIINNFITYCEHKYFPIMVKRNQKISFQDGILSNLSLTPLIGAIIFDIKHEIVLMENITLPPIPVAVHRIWHLYVESKTLYTSGQPHWRAYNVSSYSNAYSTLTSIDSQMVHFLTSSFTETSESRKFLRGELRQFHFKLERFGKCSLFLTEEMMASKPMWWNKCLCFVRFHLSEKILKVRKVFMHDQGHLTLEDVNLSLELLDEMDYLKESTSFLDCTNYKLKFVLDSVVRTFDLNTKFIEELGKHESSTYIGKIQILRVTMGGVSKVSELNHLLQSISSNSNGRIPRPKTTIAVTNAILQTLNLGNLSKAVSILFDSPVPFPYSVYARLFQLTSSTRAIVEARKLESHLVTFSSDPPVFLLNRAIEAYGNCCCVHDARELFEEMPLRNGGSWNSMLTAYSKNGYDKEALLLFSRMNRFGVFANEITFASVLGSCAKLLCLCLSRQIHALTSKYGFGNNIILETSLVDVYGKCWIMSDARRKFDEIRNPNDVSWNVIVRRYVEMNDGKEAIFMFFKMFPAAVSPLSFTFSNALVACSSISALREGIQIHGVTIKMCFDVDEVVSCSLIDMYVKCGKLEQARAIFEQSGAKDLVSWTSIVWGYAINGKTSEARELFNDMPERNLISWNAMLAGYIHSFQWEEALAFLHLLRMTTKDIDHVTIGLVLNICAGLSDVQTGKQVHGFVYRHGLFSKLNVSNALLDMYGKCGNLTSARVLFFQMSQLRDNVSWNTLLTSYACHGQSEQALTIFWEMQWETQPSKFTFATLLAACANILAFEQGRQSHAFIIRNGYEIDIVLAGALVDMYSKCRCLDYALRIFEGTSSRDIVLWNSIMIGCSHKKGVEVLKFFGLMQETNIKPDHVTFQAVLTACLHEDLVELGSQYFHSMSTNYGIIPRLEHYEIMIELFSRSNQMDELDVFVKEMPFEPTIPMLTRVLDACRKHGCMRLGNWAAKQLAELNSSSELQF
ncbi:hypothetical protein G4B88_006472 [Cannabis sativa]|uniref:F-box domain-containing protein n=1 Tax=Cannabis sativa TaxID=3483 RepID=A0A7J6H2K7_CANSA|nr:hypothetical protein G4B88_006472 [Cannabis sativa]